MPRLMRGLVWQRAAFVSAGAIYRAAGVRSGGRHNGRRTDPRNAPCELCARERASAGKVMLRGLQNLPRRHGDTEKSEKVRWGSLLRAYAPGLGCFAPAARNMQAHAIPQRSRSLTPSLSKPRLRDSGQQVVVGTVGE